MTITVSQLADDFDRVNSGDARRYETTIWCCHNCAENIRNRGSLIMVGSMIHPAADGYECDICGQDSDLFECMV